MVWSISTSVSSTSSASPALPVSLSACPLLFSRSLSLCLCLSLSQETKNIRPCLLLLLLLSDTRRVTELSLTNTKKLHSSSALLISSLLLQSTPKWLCESAGESLTLCLPLVPTKLLVIFSPMCQIHCFRSSLPLKQVFFCPPRWFRVAFSSCFCLSLFLVFYQVACCKEEEADLHVNQQEHGPQVTEIEQWPARAINRSGAVRGLEQHWCV